MALTFPASPSSGDRTVINNTEYRWDGEKWTGTVDVGVAGITPAELSALDTPNANEIPLRVNDTNFEWIPAYSERHSSYTSTATTTLNLANATVFTVTLATNTTIAFSNLPRNGEAFGIVIRFLQDGTGGRTVTWPASVVWPAATPPTITSTADATDVVTLYTTDGGTTWYGFTAGQAFA